MSAGAAIYAKLTTDLANLVGTRVYPELIPESSREYPAIVYELGDVHYDRTYTGRSGLVKQTVTIVAVDRTIAGCQTLSNAIVEALDGRGEWGGVQVLGCFQTGQSDEPAPLPGMGPDEIVYLRELEYQLWWG